MDTTHTEATSRPATRLSIWLGVALLFTVTGWIGLAAAAERREPVPSTPPPNRLADTGLYADAAARTIASDVLAYSPQYPLWTDGATKARWVRIPRGTSIDASDPDAWRFPTGTRFWKEFSFGRRVETRTMTLGADGRWTYATYAWNADESGAILAPEGGVRGACETPEGTRHDLPSVADCGACHDAGRSAVLGFGTLQLSSDRDALAPHAETPTPGSVDLADLVERRLVRGLPREFVETPPRIPASTDRERAALGYLHGNCGSCHNAYGPLASLGLELDMTLAGSSRRKPAAIRSTLGRISRYQPSHGAGLPRIDAGDPDDSTLVARMGSRSPVAAMPPLGTRAVDHEALALIREWIRNDLEPESFTQTLNAISKRTR